ncbi:hypothetical protein F0562_032204 [Nyssa sinensis]|uniref:Uncharacterized protein n=1 Tax=Nyssa sinensis TaxID=561372 RepID=A0A5J5AYX1_9ASTE|nr:hypothetical protein F0562_032204 [Nyssa sinensis]
MSAPASFSPPPLALSSSPISAKRLIKLIQIYLLLRVRHSGCLMQVWTLDNKGSCNLALTQNYVVFTVFF